MLEPDKRALTKTRFGQTAFLYRSSRHPKLKATLRNPEAPHLLFAREGAAVPARARGCQRTATSLNLTLPHEIALENVSSLRELGQAA